MVTIKLYLHVTNCVNVIPFYDIYNIVSSIIM